jgi:GT2 family glycosyltransferase
MISVIVPGRNLGEITAKCIHHVKQYAGELCRVVYIDNGSEMDETITATAELDCGDDVVGMGGNEGFSKAINAGVHATEDCDLLLLNNDAFIMRETIPTLSACLAAHPKLAAVGPLTDGPGLHNYTRGTRMVRFQKAVAAMTIEEKSAQCRRVAEPDELCSTSMVAFFCTLIRREAWEDVGPLDEQFVDGLGADDDWCLRARAKGWTVGIAPAAFCSHLGASSFKSLGVKRNCSAAYAKLRQKHGRVR